jgi:hypothetical protein
MGTQSNAYAHINTLSSPYYPVCLYVRCKGMTTLISDLLGLLQTLDDCGSPPLASRAPTLSPPTSLRTSDHKSMMAYMGLPLDIFGKVSIAASCYN